MAMSLDTMERLNVDYLAQMAQCSTPEPYSAGADFLYSVRANVLEILMSAECGYIDAGSAREQIAGVADSCIPVHTADTWATFDDLGAWDEDITDHVPVGGAPLNMTLLANTALYLIADRLIGALVWATADLPG